MFEQKSQEKKNKTQKSKKSACSASSFILKTYQILEVIQTEEYEKIICWNEEGSAFQIKNIELFSDEVLSKYFKHNNFSSFVRQLNMYGFHKTRTEINESEFKHKLFRKGYKQLLVQIRRKSSQGEQEQPFISTMQKNYCSSQIEIISEINSLSTKQLDLEKLVKIIIKQNEKCQKENRYLWNKLISIRQHKKIISIFIRDKKKAKYEKILLSFFKNLPTQRKQKNGCTIIKEETQSDIRDFEFQKFSHSDEDFEIRFSSQKKQKRFQNHNEKFESRNFDSSQLENGFAKCETNEYRLSGSVENQKFLISNIYNFYISLLTVETCNFLQQHTIFQFDDINCFSTLFPNYFLDDQKPKEEYSLDISL